MIPFVKSLYNTCNVYINDQPNNQVKNLVKEMELRLPYLPVSEQGKLINQIAAIKTAEKTQKLNNSMQFTGIQLLKISAGFVGGPAGSAVATYYTHDIEKELKNKDKGSIQKARLVGKRRVAGHKKKNRPHGNINSRVQESALTGIKGAAVSFYDLKGIALSGMQWGFSGIKSSLLG